MGGERHERELRRIKEGRAVIGLIAHRKTNKSEAGRLTKAIGGDKGDRSHARGWWDIWDEMEREQARTARRPALGFLALDFASFIDTMEAGN